MDPREMLGVVGLLCLENKTNLVAICITIKMYDKNDWSHPSHHMVVYGYC